MRRLLPLLPLLTLLVSSDARAEWWVQSPSSSCVEHDVLVARVLHAVPPDVLALGPRRTARIDIQPLAGRVVILVAREGVTLGERVIEAEGADCEQLLQAAVFVLVTLIEGGVGDSLTASDAILPADEGATRLAAPAGTDPSEAPETSDESAEPDAQGGEAANETASDNGRASNEGARDELAVRGENAAPRQEGIVSLGAAFRSGRLPGVGIGPRLSLGWRRANWMTSVHGSFHRGTLALAERSLEVNAGELGVRTCLGHFSPGEAWRIEGCVGMDVGFHAGRGLGFDTNASSLLVSVGAGGEAALRYAYGHIVLRVAVGGVGWIRRSRLVYHQGPNTLVAFEQSAGSVTVFAEVGLRFGFAGGS